MKTLQLGNTGEQVSALCLGAMYYGTSVQQDQAYRLLDQYVDRGGTFIDTANITPGGWKDLPAAKVRSSWDGG